MPELRKDPIIGRWVIVAAERGERPSSYTAKRSLSAPGFCPFCPGNENKTPEEILAYRPSRGKNNEPDWWVRVVPNKYPALRPDGVIEKTGDGMYDKMTGVGSHEVVIETPSHDKIMADYDLDQLQEVLWAYRDRILELQKIPRNLYVMIYKNHGKEAGASLDHPHSQLIALPIVPKRVKEEIDGAKEFFLFKERCVFCDMIRQEQENQSRIVHENQDFIAFCPFASRFPFEMWIVPKTHAPHFSEIQQTQLNAFAAILKDSLTSYKNVLSDPPFNYMLHTSPCSVPSAHFPHYHWHLEITPKLTQVAGFEWGTGFYINPVAPENAADFLRGNQPAETS
jgi:UDPglucose--hexose-1-phosphate uridylyltransferase